MQETEKELNVLVHVDKNTNRLAVSIPIDMSMVNTERPFVHLTMSKETALRLGRAIIEQAEFMIERHSDETDDMAEPNAGRSKGPKGEVPGESG